MNDYHDIYSWSGLYREEVLREVDTRRLEGRLREKGEVGALAPYRRLGPWSVRRIVLAIAVVLIMAASAVFSAPAFASHEHYLVTPGTCVDDIASGQTQKGPGEGGYHKFHENVHLGTPGMMAFENENNPVAVYKSGTGPGCPTE
jgi:hypothetical protein